MIRNDGSWETAIFSWSFDPFVEKGSSGKSIISATYKNKAVFLQFRNNHDYKGGVGQNYACFWTSLCQVRFCVR